jgi:hypothetical protein
MEDLGFDQDIYNILDATFKAALLIGGDHYTPEQLKCMIAATNLESLAKTFLLADDNPEDITLNLKQVSLGLLGTADWLKAGLTIVGD